MTRDTDHTAKVQQIAAFLGPPWKYNFKFDNASYHGVPWRWEIIDGKGKGIHFYMYKDKFSVSGQFYGMYSECIKIGISTHRDPQSIARDIERRLLPEYVEKWASAIERQKEKEQLKQSRQLIARAICKATGGTYRTDSYLGEHVISFKDGSIKRNYKDTFDLCLPDLNVEQAIQIATYAQTLIKEGQNDCAETN